MTVQKELKQVKHKRRYCRVEDCNKIVKSQGLCQRHGAKTRKCKIAGCDKQAQGNFDKMCKAHYKATKTQSITKPPTFELNENVTEPTGESVFRTLIPNSIGWTPRTENDIMPIVSHLKEGFDANKPRAWHRNEERLARGLPPVHNPAIPLDGWERELVWMEICMLSGCNQASFHHLARAWGRDKGFHMTLSRYICGHQGDMQRENHMRRQNESRKSKGPIIMNPGSTDLEPQQAKVLDHCNLDSLIGDTSIPFDPTVGYQAPPEPIQHSAGKRGKRNPMFCPVIEPEAENDAPMPAPAPFHHIPQAMSPPHVIPFNPPIQAMQHQNMYGLQTRIAQAPIGMMMPNMMDHRRKMISHEALILDENNMMHQQV